MLRSIVLQSFVTRSLLALLCLLAATQAHATINLSVGDSYWVGFVYPDAPASETMEVEYINYLTTLAMDDDSLVDGDYASNGTNWQWVAGTGVDSNMFPRIMAPLSQSEKFDAAGYIREYVPELADLDDAQIHDPDDEHRPDDYPAKLIGHKEARERALQAYRDSKG